MKPIDRSIEVLVIAQSARMLAQLAVQSGFRPVAIDCFADEDTRQLAVETIKVASLALADVRSALDAIGQRYGLVHVVYGSGFEKYTETLDYLGKRWTLLGNSAAVFRQFHDKPRFFALLARLAIPFPETVFAPPEGRGEWLIKPMRGEGGYHISRYRPGAGVKAGPFYWQRRLAGQSMSVLFLASRGRVKLLGFNRQWTTAFNENRAFVFAGVSNHAPLSAENRKQLSDWLTKLVDVYPLCGLGSLDFMWVDGQCVVLEVNPRIPASAQLYSESIFSHHIHACLGGFGGGIVTKPKAYKILYAQQQFTVPTEINWPEWVVDRPAAGALIGKGEPICSIIAGGKTVGQAEERLRRQQKLIEQLFKIGL